MRYNLESTLPINAFSPRAGRGPFSRGMTLEGGGGGGGVLGGIGNAIGSVVKGVSDVVKGVVQPVYNATLKQIPGVDNALVNLDKSVGKAIPGGWGTVASVAASFIPGSQLATMGLTRTGLATGLGALTGSGVLRKGNQFNLMGAIAGGAMAYGLSNLSQGLQEAGTATPGGVSSAVEEAARGAGSSVTPTANALQNIATDGSNIGAYYTPPVPAPSAPVPGQFVTPSVGEFAGLRDVATGSVNMGADGLGSLTTQTPGLLGGPAPAGVLDKIASGAGETVSGMGSSIADAGSGIKNLAGFGPQIGTQSAAYNALTSKFGAGSLGATIMGASTLASIEEQKNMLDQQLAQGNIAQDEYNAALADIEKQRAYAESVVSENPFNPNPNRDVSVGATYYPRADVASQTMYPKSATGTLYAMGGSVDDELGSDDFVKGGGLSSLGYAVGGMPRFLSGGGDGMSDSIKANIEGKQEARLADGEFVIPADVVSHLGNGSSKAGAKQLYSMMDRIRTARTGTKKQGKQVNPRKFMPA